MRIRLRPHRHAALWFLAAALLHTGCEDSPTGPSGDPAGPVTGSLVGLSDDGVSTSALLSATNVPVTITATFAVRNASSDRVSITLSGLCPAGVRLYASPDRSGPPVWDSGRLDRCQSEIALVRVIAPGDSLQVHFHTNEAEILGDSLSAGRYLASVILVGADGSVVELPSGEVTLTGASLVDVSVRRGEEVAVPGTALRIGLLDVTDDQRCAARDVEGNPISCFWQGNANLVLTLSAPGVPRATEVMRSGFDPELVFAGFLVRFFGLSPERIEGLEIDPDAYVATLRVVVP